MILVWFAISIAALILLITKAKVHPFLSLILVSVFLGIVSGVPLVNQTTADGETITGLINLITAGFGGTLQSIGLIVAFGVIIGELLEATGGAQKIADAVLKLIGEKHAAFATALTGAIVSIPVFCDSGYVILSPVIKGISRRGKIPLATLAVALMAGLLTTHGLVPPTPGPVAVAGILGANIGKVMLYGIIVTIPVIIACSLYGKSKFVAGAYPELAEETASDVEQEKGFDEIVAQAPTTFKSFMPIVVPLVLIVCASFFGNSETTVGAITTFIGTPWVALLIGVGLSFLLPTKVNGTVTNTWISKALRNSAEILLITAAAGSFSKVLQSTTIGATLTELIMNSPLPALVVPFLMAWLLCAATGSTTVAMTTSAGLIAPMMAGLALSPELVTLAIAAGSIGFCQTNSSYFWCVAKLSDMDVSKGYRCITVTTVIMATVAFAMVMILSMFIH